MSKVSFTPSEEEKGEPRPPSRGNMSRTNSNNNMSRPNSAGSGSSNRPVYVPEVAYNHAAPEDVDDDAHVAARKAGEVPPLPMTRQLSRANTLASLRARMSSTAQDVETDEEREVVRRKSIVVAQQAVFKVEKDKHGLDKEARPPLPAPARHGREGVRGGGGGGGGRRGGGEGGGVCGGR